MTATKIEWTDATKRCRRCDVTKPAAAFARDQSRSDGLTYWCRDCRNARARARYAPVDVPRKPGPDPLPERDGDARQARRTINHLVETGVIPPPNEFACVDCGHEWAPGQRRHEYDHHHGYGSGQHRNVEPVCTTCHHRRELNRREEAA